MELDAQALEGVLSGSVSRIKETFRAHQKERKKKKKINPGYLTASFPDLRQLDPAPISSQEHPSEVILTRPGGASTRIERIFSTESGRDTKVLSKNCVFRALIARSITEIPIH
jgi:hypothetical protein